MDFTGDKIYKCGDSLSKIYKCGEVVWSADTTPDYYLYLTVLRYILPYEPETFEVEVFTNLPEVQAIIPVDWFSMTGREDNFYYFSTVTNSKPEERNTTLTFTDTMGLGLSASCQVIQRGMPYEELPLTFEAEDRETFLQIFFPRAITFEYSYDGGENWRTVTDDRIQRPLWIDEDHKTFMIKANETSYNGTSISATTGPFKVYGNIMSLIDSTNYSNLTSLTTAAAFRYFFMNCTGLTSVENLVLPATTLTNNCYSAMFYGCTSITTPPELPATTLDYNCYQNMFNGCTSLTSAPILLARTLANSCYGGMFAGCTSLTTAPDLQATTLADYCYYGMFIGCTSLNYIKCLATDKSASNCTTFWVQGVPPIGTFIKKGGVEWPTGDSGIPSGWTVIEE